MKLPGRGLALLAAACVVPAIGSAAPARPAGREPGYFVWAGVTPPAAALAGAARGAPVYLLAGEVRRGDPGHVVPLRAVPRLGGPAVWLTVRTERIDWTEPTYADLLRTLRQWRRAGNRVAGVQVDFDAATRGLAGYRRFLAGLRRRLPSGTRLSITGLLDWSAHGDPAALAGLAGTVDEIVVQTYQGRRTIPGYAGYLRGLTRLDVPYRVGVVEDGSWAEPAFLRDDPEYRGTVIFLVASRSR